jgi:uncharacterized membrane protein
MIIMALDHVRDLIHVDSVTQSPTNLSTTTPILFFTRWITHLCAPTFVFLAGTSAYMSWKNSGDISGTRKFLLKRGLWLILLDFSVVNLGLFFDLGFHNLIFEVLSAIGFGFIILSFLLSASVRTIGSIGLAILFLHDLLPLIPFSEGSVVRAVLSPLFNPGAFPMGKQTVFIMGYPPIPWLGILLTGFAAGKFFELPDQERKRIFGKLGLGILVFFIVLRFINIYGDPAPWSVQKTPVYTFLSFMNVTKYPPSLLFCSATLGVMFWMLAFGEQVRNRFTAFASVYGKAPLFYFVIHFYMIHLTLIVLLFFQGFHWTDLSFSSGNFGRPKGAESGLSLGAIYIIWACVVLVLYQPCRWFGRYKAQHKHVWWLKYI